MPVKMRLMRNDVAVRPLTLDGAMGTELLSKGASLEHGLDSLNLSHPKWVGEVHESYANAGADILLTNTFGANRGRLQTVGMADSLVEINEAGVRLARAAAGDRAWVAGCVGPGGGTYTNYLEQAQILHAAGVDLFVLETFLDIDELGAAVCACRAVDGEIVIAAHATLGEDGDAPSLLIERFNDWPVDIVGLNCSFGPGPMLRSIEKILAHSNRPVSAMPSTGYGCTPEEFGVYARRFFALGGRLFGGCCGTTPAHIAKIAASPSDHRPN